MLLNEPIEDIGDTTIRFFGTTWHAPACHGRPFEPPPVGEPCTACHEPVAATDSGLMIPFLPAPVDGRQPDPRWAVWHRDCFLHHVGVPDRTVSG